MEQQAKEAAEIKKDEDEIAFKVAKQLKNQKERQGLIGHIKIWDS
jgi:hypothetical protein